MTAEGRSTGPSATQSSTSAMSSQPGSDEREFVITRIIDAPRALMFKAWTDPAHLAQWWGPKDFTNVCRTDVRPGGAYRIVMRSPDGVDYPIKGVYREIVEAERLVMTYGLRRTPGRVARPRETGPPEGR